MEINYRQQLNRAEAFYTTDLNNLLTLESFARFFPSLRNQTELRP